MYIVGSNYEPQMKMDKIVKHIANNGGFASMKELKEANFHPRDIAILLNKKTIEKVKPGYYRITDFSFFENVNISLITICRAEPKAVISLLSALDYFELTDFSPSEIFYAIPHSQKKKDISITPTRVFYFRERFYKSGVDIIKTQYGNLKVYNKEKTICDMFRYRNKLGEDLAIQALKNYLNLKKKNIAKLIQYAELCQVKTIIMPLLKGLVV